jgi:RNA polymerase sigma factor (sigma-70 family)
MTMPPDDVVERLRVVSALRELAPRQREAVILCYLLEQTQEEAARVMGISRGGLAATLHDARRNWPLEPSPEEVR